MQRVDQPVMTAGRRTRDNYNESGEKRGNSDSELLGDCIRGSWGVHRSGPLCWHEVLRSIDRQIPVTSVDESACKAEHEPDQAA